MKALILENLNEAREVLEELSGVFRGKRPALPAISISDPSHITCTANDYSFDEIFSRYVEGVGQQGDVLLAISTPTASRRYTSRFFTFLFY